MPTWICHLRKDYLLLWWVLVLLGLAYRPLTPIDETRAVSVAWEMWLRHDWLVPHLNGEPYSHKPPLLQWGINALWFLFGVHEWSARLVAPLFALANLFLTEALARRLWPEAKAAARLAPWILLGAPLWAVWSTLTLYDMLTTFFTLLGLLGVLRASRGETRAGWVCTGLAIGGGMLAKGPVVLLLILPMALMAPWWGVMRPPAGWWRWYRGSIGAVLLGAVIALTWAIPAGLAGGEEYRRMIFWGQSAGRIANAFAHQRPFWWYLEILPLMLFPWVLWPPLWRCLKRFQPDFGLRFCALHAGSILLIFSLISGKQVHYLLPLLPSVSLLLARSLTRGDHVVTRGDQRIIGFLLLSLGLVFSLIPLPEWGVGTPEWVNEAARIAKHAPLAAKLAFIAAGVFLLYWRPGGERAAVRGITLALVAMLFGSHLVYRQVGWDYHQMTPFAQRLTEIQRRGSPIAHLGKYSGDFQFLGRLERSLVAIDDREDFRRWLNEHPEGHAVIVYRFRNEPLEEGAEYGQFYRGSRRITLWKAAELRARPELLRRLLD
jgi:4-amino-4-deoxy-L-arabinose transferase-like glycosyltransferase